MNFDEYAKEVAKIAGTHDHSVGVEQVVDGISKRTAKSWYGTLDYRGFRSDTPERAIDFVRGISDVLANEARAKQSETSKA